MWRVAGRIVAAVTDEDAGKGVFAVVIAQLEWLGRGQKPPRGNRGRQRFADFSFELFTADDEFAIRPGPRSIKENLVLSSVSIDHPPN